MKSSLLFDAGSILTLVRNLGGRAADKLLEGSTIQLAYYEVGNALWKECFLLKRISLNEAGNLLGAIYAIIGEMEVTSIKSEDEGNAILNAACKFSLTFYDSAYLAQAVKTLSTLVTDDRKLAKMAQNAGLKTLSSGELSIEFFSSERVE